MRLLQLSLQLCATMEVITRTSFYPENVNCTVELLVLSVMLLPFLTSPFIKHNTIITLFKSSDIYALLCRLYLVSVNTYLYVPLHSWSWPCCVTL